MIESAYCDITGRMKILLEKSPIAEVRRIHVQREGNRVMLSGRVRTYYAKQMAQETVRQAGNGLHIINKVDVD